MHKKNVQIKRALLSINAPHFNAGAVFHRTDRWRCVEAAPIIKWMVGKNILALRSYLQKKGWEHEWIKLEDKIEKEQGADTNT